MAINGVWGWRAKKTENKVILQFDDISWQGRKVYIVFDSDVQTNEKVQTALTYLAKELKLRGAFVFLVNIPKGTGDKAGIDEVLAHWDVENGAETAIKKCLKLLETAAPFSESKKENQATRILNFASDVELFHTPDGESFARIEVGDHYETYHVRTKAFRSWLAFQFFQTENQMPSSQALQDAINTIEGKALFEGKEESVFVRFASSGGNIYCRPLQRYLASY